MGAGALERPPANGGRSLARTPYRGPAIELLTVVAVALLMVVAIHLIGGWVYSEGFKRDVLNLGERQRPPAIVVRAVTRDTVTLEAAEPRQDIGHPGTLGLYWDDGYSQVHEVIEVRDRLVIRRFEAMKGGQPPVCPEGPLDTCTKVDLGSYAFPDNPSDVGLAFSEIEYASPLGPIGAWTVPGPSSGRWALHVHGWTAHRREALRLLPSLHQEGWSSMVIDYRNDAGAPPDPGGKHRFGLTEWEDVEGAVSHLLDNGAEGIVLVGYSTGAAHAMAFLERSQLAEAVIGIVFDSPNINLAETVRHGSMDSRFPVVNLPVTRLVGEVGMWLADLRWQVDWKATNYILRADRTVRVPTLVFHGWADPRVPISTSQALAALLPDLVTLVETPAAGHVMSWNADRDRYEKTLREFMASL